MLSGGTKQSPEGFPGEVLTVTYDWRSKIHEGPQPHHGNHTVFRMGTVAEVALNTRGREHSGSLEFSFSKPDGGACTYAQWLSSRPKVRETAASAAIVEFHHEDGMRKACRVESDGLAVALKVKGKKNEASVTIRPPGEILRPSWCYCENLNV